MRRRRRRGDVVQEVEDGREKGRFDTADKWRSKDKVRPVTVLDGLE